MSLVQRTVCSCDVCGHEWLPEKEQWPSGVMPQLHRLPKRCPSRKCRSTGWNAKKEVPDARNIPRSTATAASGGRVSEAVVTEYADVDLAGIIEPARPQAELTDILLDPVLTIYNPDGLRVVPEEALAPKITRKPKKGKQQPVFCRHGLAYHPGCNA